MTFAVGSAFRLRQLSGQASWRGAILGSSRVGEPNNKGPRWGTRSRSHRADHRRFSVIAFARTCAAIAATASKLEKVRLVAEYLAALGDADLPPAARFFTGNPFPQAQERSLAVGGRTIVDAASNVWGIDGGALSLAYRATGDLGAALGPFVRPAVDLGLFRTVLTPAVLYALLVEIADSAGKNAQKRRRILCERVFSACTDPLEATYVVKIMTGELRIGLREGLVVDAVAAAFARDMQRGAARGQRRRRPRRGGAGRQARHARPVDDRVPRAARVHAGQPDTVRLGVQGPRRRGLAGRGQVRRHSRPGARHARARLALLPHAQRRGRVVSGNRRRAARAARLVRARRRDRRRARRPRAAVPLPASPPAAQGSRPRSCCARCRCAT